MLKDSEGNNNLENDDAMVCYCYKKRAKELMREYDKLGSLEKLQAETKVGMGCGGCRVSLAAMFNETGSDINKLSELAKAGSLCVKPGNDEMLGFMVSYGSLQSTIYCSNAVAPQLGECDATTPMQYTLYNFDGTPLLQKAGTLHTNKTFQFSTKDVNLPNPFCGIFKLRYNRQNQGASRFNIHWSNKKSVCSTHENSTPGRPRVFLSTPVNKKFIEGNSTMYLGIMNPHDRKMPFTITVFDQDTKDCSVWETSLDARASTWVNATENFYKPFSAKHPNGTYIIRVETLALHYSYSFATYFFFHNEDKDLWSAQHL